MKIEIIENEQTPELLFIENVDKWIDENSELIKTYFEFVKDKKHAIGLAANQALIDGKRCVERFFLEKDVHNNTWDIIINPKIIETLGFAEGRIEGCLTWPNKDIVAYRYRRIKVSYYTVDGEYREETITKFRSHVWQHEINHLDGIEEKVVKPGTVWFNDRKIQRNELCPCKSGKKYKKCCQPYEINDYILPRTQISPEFMEMVGKIKKE